MKYLKPAALAVALLAAFGLNITEKAAASGRLGPIAATAVDALAPSAEVPPVIKVGDILGRKTATPGPGRNGPRIVNQPRANKVFRNPARNNPPRANRPGRKRLQHRADNRPRILGPGNDRKKHLKRKHRKRHERYGDNHKRYGNDHKRYNKHHKRHSKRHKRYRRRYDNRGVFIGLYPYYTYDPYYDDPYYYDEPEYVPERLTCREVIGLLRDWGYRHIKVHDCTGKVYTFVAYAGRKRYRLRIYSHDGSFKTRRRI